MLNKIIHYIIINAVLTIIIVNNVSGAESVLEDYYIKKLKSYKLTEQVITVENIEKGYFRAKVDCLERKGNDWHKIYSFDAVTGRIGIIPADNKREGDGGTPDGVYSLGFAFGYEKQPGLKMEYRQLKDEDLWIDDPEHSLYNQFYSGKTDAKSFEKMRRADNLYSLGIVINYNMNPVVRYKGSAIFLHIWRDSNKPTAGCVAVSEEAIKKILAWLNPIKDPLIILKTPNK